jgi:hypothetical protein
MYLSGMAIRNKAMRDDASTSAIRLRCLRGQGAMRLISIKKIDIASQGYRILAR